LQNSVNRDTRPPLSAVNSHQATAVRSLHPLWPCLKVVAPCAFAHHRLSRTLIDYALPDDTLHQAKGDIQLREGGGGLLPKHGPVRLRLSAAVETLFDRLYYQY
jgi:hypothetical protein